VATAVSPGTVSYNQAFEYDRWGNADCNPASLACANRSFNTAKNQIADSGFLYDAAGNLLDDGTGMGTHTYQWDAEGRMRSVDGAAGSLCQAGSINCMTYNAFGQVVEEKGADFDWVYLYGAGGEKIAWWNGTSNGWQRHLIYAAGREIRLYSTDLRYYYHRNHLGSGTMMTDQTGAPIGERLYYPWGDRWAEAGAWVTPSFASMTDPVVGTGDIYPTQFRHYFPTTFRWMTPDPLAGDISNPQSLNRYAYVGNNPENFIDPLGLDTYPDGSPCDPFLDPFGCPPPCDPFTDITCPVPTPGPRGPIPPFPRPRPGGGVGNAQNQGGGTNPPSNFPCGEINGDPLPCPDSPLWPAFASAIPIIVVVSTAEAPKQDTQSKGPSLGSQILGCAGEHYLPLAAGIISALPSAPVPKTWVFERTAATAGASRYMSATSALEWKLFGQAGPGIPWVGRALGTPRLLGLVGRAAPYVSLAFFTYDAAAIGVCVAAGGPLGD
jgi:RHS repeat-associated protein